MKYILTEVGIGKRVFSDKELAERAFAKAIEGFDRHVVLERVETIHEFEPKEEDKSPLARHDESWGRK